MIVNNICFIHIPKAGGTSIEKNILEYETNFFRYSYLKLYDYIADIIKIYASLICYLFFIEPLHCNVNRSIFRSRNKNKNLFIILLRIFNDYMLKIYHSTYLLEIEKYKNIKFFSCVRHPQSRLVSLYTFLKPKTSFDKFVIGILLPNNHNNTKLDYPPKIAYQEQTSFIVNKKNDICVKWFKIEEIDVKWKDICKYLDIPFKPVGENNSSIKHNSKKENSKENWKYYYDKYPYLINIVKDYYKNDFINFNYDLYIPES